jgi:MFS family permease
MLSDYPSRSFLGFSLMATQAFLYNAIFFTFSLMLVHVYHIADQNTSLFVFPFAASNLIGPLVLGKLFNTLGRHKMITFTYCVSGILLAINARLFFANLLTATTQTVILCAIFFFASAGTSSAY